MGRFAPSPTGPLHIGSLVTAVAGFLHARCNEGEWLVRIDDIDPPREIRGASDEILRALERMDLAWDREVLYQRTRTRAYRTAAERLIEAGLAYRCSCTRAELRRLRSASAHPEHYPGFCRGKTRHERATAIRVLTCDASIHFHDLLQGDCSYDLEQRTGDYVVFRRDGLPAYHLANVLDDAELGITHVIRGVDLLDPTAVHIHLHRTLGLGVPEYGHLPVIVNAAGQKLSKRTGATPVDLGDPGALAFSVLTRLGLPPPEELRGTSPASLWAWAIPRWELDRLARRRTLQEHAETVT